MTAVVCCLTPDDVLPGRAKISLSEEVNRIHRDYELTIECGMHYRKERHQIKAKICESETSATEVSIFCFVFDLCEILSFLSF